MDFAEGSTINSVPVGGTPRALKRVTSFNEDNGGR